MKPASGTRKPYNGTVRSLVLALDVGTTFSGVSYAILEPSEVPKIHGVTRFPGQEHVAGNSKIPSIMYYDPDGIMKAAGAEAENVSMAALAEDEGWTKAELFKLRLRPKSMKLKMNGMRLAPLPTGKTAVDVFGDFLSYLFRCTRSFIIDTHANGHALWRAVEHDIQFVLSHPNGWEGAQQAKMRRAAVYGGLIPDTDEGKARIRFVTEGEASLHACVLNGLAADVLSNPSGHGFIVADAGGGTLDISSYAIRGSSPLVIEEIAPPDCVFAGSVFVSRRARAFLEEKLKSSKYGSPDSLDHITKRFDETTKRLFRDSKELQFVPFGSPLDKDLPVGIRGGQLKLHGTEVAGLFEPSIEAAVLSIKHQIESSGGSVKSVWLVGGFAASPWLFMQLQERLSRYHVTVSRPDTQTSKAVADGAIGFYCDHHVSARISKFMYGVEYLREFDPTDEEHVARKHRLFEMPSGPRLLPDAFDCILARGVKVKESNVFSRKYCTEVTNLSTLSVFEVEIWCYRGGDTIPKWIHRSSEVFSTLCYVRADLSPLAGSAQAKQGRGGKTYWTIVFSIEIHFGLTEFKARIKWVDNGKTRYGPASIVYNEGGTRAEEDEPDSSPEDNVTVLSSPSDRGHSRSVSQPPSRDPSMRSGRPSVQASPRLPTHPPVEPPVASRGIEVERQRTVSSSSSASRSVQHNRAASISSSMSKAKSREIYAPSGAQTPRSGPPPPEPMRPGDRSINVSGQSAKSTSTHLGEQLNAVWGQSTPSVSSPLAENSPYNAFSRQPSRRETKPPTPKEPTPPTMSKQPTPPTMSSLQTPVITPPPLAPHEQLVPRPPSELSYATPIPSKPPTPPPVAAPVTPTKATPAASKIPTPASGSKAATPTWGSKAATPAWGSKAATPASGSKAATPTSGSKAATPAWGSKIPTPATQSKAATPATQSKAATPRAMSKAATPTAATPRAMTPPPPEPEPEPAPAEPVPVWEPEPAAAPEPELEIEPPPPAPAPVSALFGDLPPIIHPSGDGDEGAVIPPFPGDMPGSMGGDGPPAGNPAGVMSPMADLWTTPVPETTAPQTSAGLFSDFLSGPSWGGASKITSGFGFGGFGSGNNNSSGGGGGGGGFGSFGSFGWGGGGGGDDGDNKAAEEEVELQHVQAEEAEKKRVEEEEQEAARKAAEEEEERKKQEEEAAKKKPAKRMTKREQALAKKAEEKERKAKEAEDAAAREAEEAAKQAEGDAEAARKAADDAGEIAKRAEEDARRAEEEAADAAKRAAEEAAAAQQAAEEAAAAAAAATTPEQAAVAADLAAEAQHAQAEAVEAAQEAQVEAAEAEQKEEVAEEAKVEAAEAEQAAEQAEDAAAAAEGEAKKLEDAQQAMDDEWNIPVKVKKGKKGAAASAAAAPDALSRETSEANDGFAAAGGKKKKGKKR